MEIKSSLQGISLNFPDSSCLEHPGQVPENLQRERENRSVCVREGFLEAVH